MTNKILSIILIGIVTFLLSSLFFYSINQKKVTELTDDEKAGIQPYYQDGRGALYLNERNCIIWKETGLLYQEKFEVELQACNLLLERRI